MSKLLVMLICAFGLAACANAQTATTPTTAAASQSQAVESGTPGEICDANTRATDPATRNYDGPEDVLQADTDYRAVFCTPVGPIYVDLFEDYAPVAVNSFVFLAQHGFYNNTTFHRVIENFMAQGGDPEGTGAGGPGYSFGDEFVGFLHFDRPGWLAMANRGAGTNTNGSQFFITTGPASHLDNMHTIFGEVLEGQENVVSISPRDPQSATAPGTALDTVVIITDPAIVTTTYEAPDPADQDTVAAALASAEDAIPPNSGLAIDAEHSGMQTTTELIDSLPSDARASYGDLLQAHNHEYRASSAIVNETCDLDNLQFISVAYSLDRFATPDDAAAALADDAWASATTADGFSEDVASSDALTVFSKTDNACDTDVVTARGSWQRGHFIATSEVTVPAADAPPLDLLLTNFGGSVYERIFTDVLRPEIRE